jgi:hypothetical protein
VDGEGIAVTDKRVADARAVFSAGEWGPGGPKRLRWRELLARRSEHLYGSAPPATPALTAAELEECQALCLEAKALTWVAFPGAPREAWVCWLLGASGAPV